MKRRTMMLTLLLAVVGSVYVAANALATDSSGVVPLTYAVGHFDSIDSTTKTDINLGDATDFWQARINTKGASDIYMLQNTVTPGGTFGWHSHPGPSLIIVKSGTATYYLASDPTCTPHVVPAGSGFVDNGNDPHIVNNEGTVDLVTVVVSFVPTGFARRINQPAPSDCP